MKGLRIGLVVLTAALTLVGLTSTAYAFHSGGVAECAGCHNMHEATGLHLLEAVDASSTCLNCHEGSGGYHVATPNADTVTTGMTNLTPGGDFGWIKKDYTWNPGWAPQNEDGDRHGHNIIAADPAFNYVQDATNVLSPGGAYPRGLMACTSCHDPHAQGRRLADGNVAMTGAPIAASGSYPGGEPTATTAVGLYRILAGPGYTTDSVTYDGAPVAKVPSSYNRSEDTTQTRVAYGWSDPAATGTSGQESWSEWCGTCHGAFHQNGFDASTDLAHPTDGLLGATVAGNYNKYVGSGDWGNTVATSYLSLVPYVENSSDYAFLATKAVNDGTVTTGPDANQRIGCLSCHRAHASGWEYALRWDYEIELIVVNGEWPGTDAVGEAGEAKWAKGRTQAERLAAYNDIPANTFATYQRSLCNKCHAKD